MHIFKNLIKERTKLNMAAELQLVSHASAQETDGEPDVVSVLNILPEQVFLALPLQSLVILPLHQTN